MLFSFLLVLLFVASCSGDSGLNIYVTTDLHGLLLPFDHAEGRATDHSLANLATLVEREDKERILLLDNGDILQGDPLTYYYNFIDTSSSHIAADMLNHLGYAAATAGNHDIETGHAVYDRVRREYRFPMLAANAVDALSGEPYFQPYTIVERGGYRIAVLGLITPSVPRWLPESLYSGIRFEPMVSTARKWMAVIESEKPDLVVGLFHSGVGNEGEPGDEENSTLAVAVNVPGFDIIFCGHDHRPDLKEVKNIAGERVLILDGGSRAELLMNVTVSGARDEDGKRRIVTEGRLIPMRSIPESSAFIERYRLVSERVKEYTSKEVGRLQASITSRDAFFGPSAFVDIIHQLQLDLTGAQISFAAPLSFDETIPAGILRVSDTYKLYRFENFLYKVMMTGEEIDRHLEHAAGLWFETMKNENGYMLKYRYDDKGSPVMVNGTARLQNPSYNFESAMGISYTVDLRKPRGSRVSITSLGDGTPFNHKATYSVAVNSYRANGGGGHFTAAGIDKALLDQRLEFSTARDLRYYLAGWLSQKGEITPKPAAEWRVIPEKWAQEAAVRERKILFGNN